MKCRGRISRNVVYFLFVIIITLHFKWSWKLRDRVFPSTIQSFLIKLFLLNPIIYYEVSLQCVPTLVLPRWYLTCLPLVLIRLSSKTWSFFLINLFKALFGQLFDLWPACDYILPIMESDLSINISILISADKFQFLA